MAQNFQEFKRTMAKLDAQLKKKKQSAKHEKNPRLKRSKEINNYGKTERVFRSRS